MTRPPWEVDQARLTEAARILLAPPSMVFDELKNAAQKARREPLDGRPEKLEAMLVERNDRLINLALASFGTDKEVFKALYKYGREPAKDEAEAQYKRGLRLGCLSNETIGVINFLLRFPHELIGNEEVERIIVSGEESEIEALFANPKCSDEMLEQLFKGEGPLQKIEEKRRAHLIHVAAKNARINTDESNDGGPDLGYYRIHRAITHCFENVPVTQLWFRVLFQVLLSIDLQQVSPSEDIAATLNRWKDFEIYDGRGEEKKPAEGHFATGLTIADEFRCILASIFGRLKDDAASGAARKSDYLPLRCVYYSHANMEINDMKAGCERDKGAYILAAAFNSNIPLSQDKRRFFEEEQLHSSGVVRIYKRNIDFLRQTYGWMPAFLAEDEEEKPERAETDEHRWNEENDRRLARIETETTALRRKVEEIAGKPSLFQSFVIVAAIVFLAVSFFQALMK